MAKKVNHLFQIALFITFVVLTSKAKQIRKLSHETQVCVNFNSCFDCRSYREGANCAWN